MKGKKRSLILLAVALVLILMGSILAGVFNGGKGAVSVTRISFDGGHGTLSGLLYMPKGASEENPRPAIVVTHGYLNSAEMQDANAIELSRRGFVVLALDQYDHGHSDLDDAVYTGEDFFGMWLPFWMWSQHDAVAYMYEQPYVLKDEAGNGIIGVTGHSMGGFSSTVALWMDEQEFAATGVRKIYAGLTEGADFSYSAFVGADVASADAAGGGRIMGKVAAQYDEFFFNAPDDPSGTVRKKNYVATPEALLWLQQESAEPNTWYDTSDGGKRIIFQPAETHPWNHFSATTTGYAVYFYMTAFQDYAKDLNPIDPASQIWQFKEAFECVALVGFVLLILAVASLLIEIPGLNKAKTGELEPAPSVTGASGKFGSVALLLCLILLPAIFFSPLMDGGPSDEMVKGLFYISCALGFSGLLGLLFSLKAEENKKGLLIGSICVMIAGSALAIVTHTPMYADGAYWSALGANSIAS